MFSFKTSEKDLILGQLQRYLVLIPLCHGRSIYQIFCCVLEAGIEALVSLQTTPQIVCIGLDVRLHDSVGRRHFLSVV